MGGGGVSGEVTFPAYIQDTHGQLLAGSETNSNDGTYSQSNQAPNKNIMELLNSAWSSDPFTGFSFTSPTTDLAESKSQFDAFYSAVTSFTEDNYGNYITQALLAVSNPTTGQIPDASVSHTTVRDNIAELLGSASSSALGELNLTAATTLWKSLISAATTELSKCDFPKEVNVVQVVTEAASNAKSNLKAAVQIAESLVNTKAAKDVVKEFENRRDTTYQNQVSQFAGTMADANAVNSSAFMFGMAILRSEQMREVSEFDAQLTLSLTQQGLSSYVQMHARQLQVSASVAQANTQAHNAFLESSINLLATLNQREEITPSQLLSIYSGLFQTELAAYLDSDRINKNAKEQRYIQGLSNVLGILTNRREFERAATALLTDQNRIKIVARSEYEGDQLDIDIRDQLWELEIGEMGARILAAPAGMAGTVDKRSSKTRSAVGGALQGAGAGASTGAMIGAAGGPIGAGAGAAIGAGLGLLQGLS